MTCDQILRARGWLFFGPSLAWLAWYDWKLAIAMYLILIGNNQIVAGTRLR